jgi:hypothetical protein
MSNAPSVKDPTLQKLLDAMVACVKRPDYSHPPTEGAFVDKDRNPVNMTGVEEFKIEVRLYPGGQAYVHVAPLTGAGHSVSGPLDIGVLSTKLT